MNKTKKIALMLASAFSVVAIASPVAQAAPDDYPSDLKNRAKDSKPYDPWGFSNRNCTSFVAWRLVNNNGFKEFHNNITGTGDKRLSHAANWGIAAKRAGYAVDDKPAKGAVVWTPGTTKNKYGHVAWVESVDTTKGKVTIEEYNKHNDGKFEDPRRTIDIKGLQFIHFKPIPETPPPAPPPPSAQPKPNPAPKTSAALASYAGTYSFKPTPGWKQTISLDSAGNAVETGEGPDSKPWRATGKYKIGTIYVTEAPSYKPYQTSALIPVSGDPAIANDMLVKRDTGVLVEASYYDATYPNAALYLPSITDNSTSFYCAANASSAWKKKCGI